MSYLRKKDKAASPAGAGMYPDDADFSERYPALYEFITCTVWPDKDSRVPGTVLFFTEGPVYKACLSDRDSGLVGFVSARTWSGLVTAIEAGLADDQVGWLVSRGFTKKK